MTYNNHHTTKAIIDNLGYCDETVYTDDGMNMNAERDWLYYTKSSKILKNKENMAFLQEQNANSAHPLQTLQKSRL